MRIFLACTPRTGNLWIRRVVARVLDLPNFAAHNPGEIDWDHLPERCLVAMHWHCTAAFSGFLRNHGFRTIVTVRHPLDVLVSILHFALLEPMTARWLEGESGNEKPLIGATPVSKEFATYCLSYRAASLLSISREWRNEAEAIIRYEDFLASPRSASQQILRALNVEPLTSIEEAITANTIDKLRPISARHFWRGRSGDWRRVITPALAKQIFERHRPYFDDFGYESDPAHDLDARTAQRNWEQLVL